jgi:hypothetical protein
MEALLNDELTVPGDKFFICDLFLQKAIISNLLWLPEVFCGDNLLAQKFAKLIFGFCI